MSLTENETVELIDTLDEIIDRAMKQADEMGYSRNARIPRQQLRCLILTSGAFLGLSSEDAGKLLGISDSAVRRNVCAARKNLHIRQFGELWDSRRPTVLSLDGITNTDGVRDVWPKPDGLTEEEIDMEIDG